MDLKFRLFPYPVLGEYYDDYKNTSFTDDLTYEMNGNKLMINMNFNMDNNEIIELIKRDKLIYVIHIECSQTSYRRIITTKDNNISFDIEDSNVTDKIDVTSFIVANESIHNYSNSDFNDDYMGEKFELEKGSIVGVGGQWKIDADKSKDELGKLPSIFSILMKKDNEREFSINLFDNKINILLSEKDYLSYKNIAKNIQFESVFHSMIVLPALIFVFEEISKGDLTEFEGYRWFKALKKSLGRYNIKLDEETIKVEGAVKLAQKILDMPFERALDGLNTIINREDIE